MCIDRKCFVSQHVVFPFGVNTQYSIYDPTARNRPNTVFTESVYIITQVTVRTNGYFIVPTPDREQRRKGRGTCHRRFNDNSINNYDAPCTYIISLHVLGRIHDIGMRSRIYENYKNVQKQKAKTHVF